MDKFIYSLNDVNGRRISEVELGWLHGGYCLTVASFLLDPPMGEPCH